MFGHAIARRAFALYARGDRIRERVGARAFRGRRGVELQPDEIEQQLMPGALAALEEVAGELERNPALELLVKACADAREAAPDLLSARRAHVVVEWLARRGIDARRLTPLGCGAIRPLTFGGTEPEREQDRRAELMRRTATAGCGPPR